jgi:hypothetical protein
MRDIFAALPGTRNHSFHTLHSTRGVAGHGREASSCLEAAGNVSFRVKASREGQKGIRRSTTTANETRLKPNQTSRPEQPKNALAFDDDWC